MPATGTVVCVYVCCPPPFVASEKLGVCPGEVTCHSGLEKASLQTWLPKALSQNFR